MSVESLKKYAYFILDLNSPKYLEILNINKQLEVDSKKVPALGQAALIHLPSPYPCEHRALSR